MGKLIVVEEKYHNILKKRAKEKGRWIQAEVNDVMEEKFGDLVDGNEKSED